MTLFPLIRQAGAGEQWELRQPWQGAGLTIREGFVFRPSVPRFAWPLVSPLETLTASAPHDYLYRNQEASRRRADRLFALIMRRQGQAEWRVVIAYYIIRAFGWLWWHDIMS